MKAINPFADRGAIVCTPTLFVGRKKELSLIDRRVIQGRTHSNLAIIGERRIGASSLAYTAFFSDRQRLQQARIVTAWISTGSSHTPAAFFSQLVKELYRNLGSFEPTDALREIHQEIVTGKDTNWGDLFDRIKQFLGLLVQQDIKEICILDDFDKASALFQDNIHFFQSLRELGYHPDFRISLVVVSRRDIKDIEEQSGAISTLDGIFEDKIYLKPYDAAELAEHYQRLSAADITLGKEQLETINAYCGGWPYLLNVLCYEVFEDYQQAQPVDIDAAYERTRNKFLAHHESIVRVLRKEERLDPLLRILYRAVEQEKESDIHEFLRSGLIRQKPDGNGYQAYSEDFGRYLTDFSDRTGKVLHLLTQLEKNLKKLMVWIAQPDTIEENWTLERLAASPYLYDAGLHLHMPQEQLRQQINEISTLQTAIEQHQKEVQKSEAERLENRYRGLIGATGQLLKQKEKILLRRTTAGHGTEHPTMALRRVAVRGYYDLRAVDIELPEDSPWIFLTGENGFGKTLLLQAIVIALNGKHAQWGGGKLVAPELKEFNVGVEVIEDGAPRLYNSGNPLFKPFTRFAAYGPSRLNVQQLATKSEAQPRSAPAYGLFNTDGVLLNIERALLDEHKLALETETSSSAKEASGRRLELLKQALLQLLSPHIDKINTTGIEVTYREAGCPTPRTFEQLASGMRSIIAMAGDMLIRLLEQSPNSASLEQLEGIVIIDELDLHLHPKLQKRLPGLLSGVLPKVQFIASTHSPIPLLGAPKNSAFLKVKRDRVGLIQAERLEITDIEKLQPNIIFTSPLFDMEDIFHIESADVSDVQTEESWGEMRENQQTREFLMQKFQERRKRFQGDKR
ncbi:MAG: AAA family ATPase [Chromatiales bacterium]|nr:AAA family ATPase [Gammaproteobacteria bacterium]